MTTIVTKYPFIGSIETRQGGRKENQDNAGFVDTPLGFLIVVCDGMGGGPGGRTASFMAIDTILTVLSDVSEHTLRKNALKYAISKANDMIYSKAKDTPELRGMGTTVAAVLMNEDSAVIAHAGDTRVYQIRKGTIIFRSSDHSVVANLVREKKLTEEEARNHPQSNIITRALGIRPDVEVEFNEVSFLRGDRFVICTDGVWGMMPQYDLIKSLSRVMGIGELTTLTAEEIDRIGQDNGGGHDNLTLAVIDAPFDSKLGKKEATVDDTVDVSHMKNTRNSSRVRKILAGLSICVVFAAVVLVVGKFENEGQTDLEATATAERGKTVTTVRTNEDVIGKDPDVVPDQEAENASSDAVSGGGQIFTERLNHSLEREQQIEFVIRNLDSLKRIEGPVSTIARTGTDDIQAIKEKKREFVDNVIKPQVKRIPSRPEKINEIVGMLDDSKTCSCDRRRLKTTRESVKHIDSIKNKVKNLPLNQ